MADRERPYEEALALLAAARQRSRNLGELLSVLTDPERSPAPAGVSPLSALVEWYGKALPELREAFSGGVLGLLRNPETDAGTLARTLAFVEAAALHEAVQPIRELVESRRLTQVTGEYSDLHGRALRAMFMLDALDPVECLKQELRHEGYVSLAFAFVREKARDQVPRALSWIALYPFFTEALRTVLLTYPIEGVSLLGAAARYTLTEGYPQTQAFLAALPHLPLLSRDREDIAMILERKPARMPAQAARSQDYRESVPHPAIGGRSPGILPGTLKALKQLVRGH